MFDVDHLNTWKRDPENIARLVAEGEVRIPESVARFISSQIRNLGVRGSTTYIRQITSDNKIPSVKLAKALQTATGILKNEWLFGKKAELRRLLMIRYPPLQEWNFDFGWHPPEPK